MDDKNYLKSLLAQVRIDISEERLNSAPCYTHAFVLGSIEDCIATIPAITKSDFNADTLLFGVRRDIVRLSMYLQGHVDGTLVFAPTSGLKVIQALAHRMHTTIHWLSIFEQFTARAYIRFESGLVTQRIFDSDDCWQRNIMYGEDLTGRGKRQFESLTAFLLQIEGHYIPKDTQWSYEKLELHPHDGFVHLEWNDPASL